MSADNGIYILKAGREYRVKYLHAVDNLYWGYERAMSGDKFNPARLLEEFGDCKSTRNSEMAIKVATRMEQEYQYVEYGIVVLDVGYYWSQVVRDGIEVAKKELSSLNGKYNKYNYEYHAKNSLEKLLHRYGSIYKEKNSA